MAHGTVTGELEMRRAMPSQQRGVVLLVVLIFILVTTLGTSTLVQMHQTQTRRDKEEQLLFVGDQFRRAIVLYYNTFPPGAQRALPKSLEDLVDDQRFPTPLHHLRRLYVDPMTRQADWQVVRAGGGIIGVRSRSVESTIKKAGFAKDYAMFEGRATYSDWVFAISF
jgi:type II secretory pathway pseudopilin PulG